MSIFQESVGKNIDDPRGRVATLLIKYTNKRATRIGQAFHK